MPQHFGHRGVARVRLSFARLRRVWKERLDGLGRLSATLLLKLVDPVADGRDHFARGFLRALLVDCFLLAALFGAASLVTLDDFYRGFLCHNDLLFPVRMIALCSQWIPSIKRNPCSRVQFYLA
jgi:hypothetical protein